jgi:hypothetical protein
MLRVVMAARFATKPVHDGWQVNYRWPLPCVLGRAGAEGVLMSVIVAVLFQLALCGHQAGNQLSILTLHAFEENALPMRAIWPGAQPLDASRWCLHVAAKSSTSSIVASCAVS